MSPSVLSGVGQVFGYDGTPVGRGVRKHNDICLKEDEYCKLISDTIEDAEKEELSNARFKWDFIKDYIMGASM